MGLPFWLTGSSRPAAHHKPVFELRPQRPEESARDRQRQALMLADQLERAQLYVVSALGLETDDAQLNDRVASVNREVAQLILDVRRLRVL